MPINSAFDNNDEELLNEQQISDISAPSSSFDNITQNEQYTHLSSPNANKDSSLVEAKRNAVKSATVQKSKNLNWKPDMLLGIEDADSPRTKNLGNTRSTSPVGKYYDAVELRHGSAEYDMYGAPRASAKKYQKSDVSMAAQRKLVAKLFNKPISDVTEEDMVSVGNQQQVQFLADSVSGNNTGERWIAPLIENAEQLNLTGKGYRDEHGNLVDDTGEIPLNIPIESASLGKTGNRTLASIANSNNGMDITATATLDPNLNARFSHNSTSRGSSNNEDEVARLIKSMEEDEKNYTDEYSVINFGDFTKKRASQFGQFLSDTADVGLDAAGYMAQNASEAFGRKITNDDLKNLSYIGFSVDEAGNLVNNLFAPEKTQEYFQKELGLERYNSAVQKSSKEFNGEIQGIIDNYDNMSAKEVTEEVAKTMYKYKNIIPENVAQSIQFLAQMAIGGVTKEAGRKGLKSLMTKAVPSAGTAATIANKANETLDARYEDNDKTRASVGEVAGVALSSTANILLDKTVDRFALGIGKYAKLESKLFSNIASKVRAIPKGEKSKFIASLISNTIGAVPRLAGTMAIEGATESMQEALDIITKKYGTTPEENKEIWNLLSDKDKQQIKDAGYMGAFIGVGQKTASGTVGEITNALTSGSKKINAVNKNSIRKKEAKKEVEEVNSIFSKSEETETDLVKTFNDINDYLDTARTPEAKKAAEKYKKELAGKIIDISKDEKYGSTQEALDTTADIIEAKGDNLTKKEESILKYKMKKSGVKDVDAEYSKIKKDFETVEKEASILSGGYRQQGRKIRRLVRNHGAGSDAVAKAVSKMSTFRNITRQSIATLESALSSAKEAYNAGAFIGHSRKIPVSSYVTSDGKAFEINKADIERGHGGIYDVIAAKKKTLKEISNEASRSNVSLDIGTITTSEKTKTNKAFSSANKVINFDNKSKESIGKSNIDVANTGQYNESDIVATIIPNKSKFKASSIYSAMTKEVEKGEKRKTWKRAGDEIKSAVEAGATIIIEKVLSKNKSGKAKGNAGAAAAAKLLIELGYVAVNKKNEANKSSTRYIPTSKVVKAETSTDTETKAETKTTAKTTAKTETKTTAKTETKTETKSRKAQEKKELKRKIKNDVSGKKNSIYSKSLEILNRYSKILKNKNINPKDLVGEPKKVYERAKEVVGSYVSNNRVKEILEDSISTGKNKVFNKGEEHQAVDLSKLLEPRQKVNNILISRAEFDISDNLIDYIADVVTDATDILLDVQDKNEAFKLKDNPSRGLIYNNNGEINADVVATIKLAADEYMAFFSDFMRTKSKEDIARMLGKQEYEITNDMMDQLSRKGVLRKQMASNIGKAAIRNLGLKPKDNIDSVLHDKIVADLGNTGIVLLESDGSVKSDNSMTAKQFGEIIGEQFKTAKPNATIGFVEIADKDMVSKKRETFDEISNEINVESSMAKNIKSTPYKISEDESARRNDITEIPKKQLEALEKLKNTEMIEVSEVADWIRDEKNIDAMLKHLGHIPFDDMEKMSVQARESAEANNRAIEKSIEAVNSNDQKSGFFDWFYTKNNRFIMDSYGINPQVDKLHRFLFVPKTQEAELDKKNTKHMNLFKHAIAQAFGMGTDKKTTKEIYSQGEYIINNISGSQMRKALKSEKYMEKLNKNVVKDGHEELEVEHLSHWLQASYSLDTYNNSGSKFKTTLSAEFDAVTSGFAIKLLQMPIINDVVGWLKKVGVFIDGKNSNGEVVESMNDEISKEGFFDSYQTLALDIKTDNMSVSKKVDPFGLWDGIKNVSPQAEANEAVSKELRTLFKYPFMTFNYSAGIKTIINAFGGIMVDDMINDMAKDGENAKEGKYRKLYVAIAKATKNKRDSNTSLQEYLRTTPVEKVMLGKKNVREYLLTIVAETYGKEVDKSLTNNFSEYISANNTINNSFRMMYEVFATQYQTEISAIEASGKLITKEAKENIIKNNLDLMPIIAGPDSTMEVEDGVIIIGSKVQGADSKFGKSQVHKSDRTSISVQALTRELDSAVNSGSVIPIHTIDGSVMGKLIMHEKGGMYIHDAIIPNILESLDSVKKYNEEWTNTGLDYSIAEQIAVAMDRVERARIEKGIAEPRIDVRMKDGEFGISDDTDNMSGLYSASFKDIRIQANALANNVAKSRKDIFSNKKLTVVQMAALPGSAHQHRGSQISEKDNRNEKGFNPTFKPTDDQKELLETKKVESSKSTSKEDAKTLKAGELLPEVEITDSQYDSIVADNKKYEHLIEYGKRFEYDTETGKITIEKLDDKYEEAVYTAHEVRHYLTYKYIVDHKDSKDIQRLIRAIKQVSNKHFEQTFKQNRLKERLDYALSQTKDEEVLAEIVAILNAEPNVREEFIEMFPQNKRSLIRRILDKIREVVFLENAKNTDIESVIEIVDNIVKKGSKEKDKLVDDSKLGAIKPLSYYNELAKSLQRYATTSKVFINGKNIWMRPSEIKLNASSAGDIIEIRLQSEYDNEYVTYSFIRGNPRSLSSSHNSTIISDDIANWIDQAYRDTPPTENDRTYGSKKSKNKNKNKDPFDGFAEVQKEIDPEADGVMAMAERLDNLSEVKANQSILNDLRVIMTQVSKNAIPKLGLYIRTSGDVTKGILDMKKRRIGIDISKKTKNTDSPALVYIHEIIHAFTENAINSRDQSAEALVSKVIQLRDTARKELTYRIFLPKVRSNYAKELKEAKETYDYIFNSKQSIHEFIAHGLTNEALVNSLKKLNVKEAKENKNIFDRLRDIFTSILDVLTGKAVSKQTNQKVYDELVELAISLSSINNRAKRKEMINTGFEAKAEKWVRIANEKGSILTKALIDKLSSFDIELLPPNSTKFQTYKWMIKTLPLMLGKRELRGIVGTVMNAVGLGYSGIIQNVMKDVREPDAIEREVERLGLYSDNIDSERQAIIAASRDIIVKAFSDKFNIEERHALTDGALRTDLSSIFDDYGHKRIITFMNDDVAIRREHKKLLKELKEVDQKNMYHNYNQAIGLGLFMATGKPGLGQMMNAKNIAMKYGTKEMISPDKKAVVLIDKIASLEAIRMTDKESRATVANLIKNEKEGLHTFLDMHNMFKEDSKTKLFKNSPHEIKGYVKEIFDDSITIEIQPENMRSEMEEDGFKLISVLENKGVGSPDERMAIYQSKSFTTSGYIRQATRITDTSRRGTTLADIRYKLADKDQIMSKNDKALIAKNVDTEIRLLNKERIKLMEEMNKCIVAPDVSSGLSPVLNNNGQVVNYRYMMSHDVKHDLLNTEGRAPTLLAHMIGSVTDKTETATHNSVVLDFIKKDMKKNYVDGEIQGRNGYEYIKISKNHHSEKIREIYSILPEIMKEEIRNSADTSTGKEGYIAVRADQVEAYFGMREAKFEDFTFMGLDKTFVPKEIRAVIRVLEGIWIEIIKIAKVDIVIRTPAVIIGNVISNFMVSVMTGSSPLKVAKRTLKNARSIKEYMLKKKKLEELKLIKNSGNRAKRDIQNIAALEADLKRSVVAPLMEAGMYQSIIEDLSKSDYDSNSKLSGFIEKKTKHLPEFVKNGANILFLTEKTKFFQVMTEMTQLSDFVARATEYQLMLERGVPSKKALNTVLDTFINYNKVSSQFEDWANRMGFMMFTKYAKRIQRALQKGVVDHPVTFLLSFLGQEFVFGEVSDIMDQNLMKKDLTANMYSPFDMLNHVQHVIMPTSVEFAMNPSMIIGR